MRKQVKIKNIKLLFALRLVVLTTLPTLFEVMKISYSVHSV